MAKKYYPIRIEYVGPNRDKGHLGQKIRMGKRAGKTNMSNEPKTSGWLGTTDDWNHTALGEMNEIEARALLKRNGVLIAKKTPVRHTDYSYGHENSEWYNKRWAYPPSQNRARRIVC